VLTLFVDSDAEVGATQIESVEIELGDSSVINEDDIVVSFIA
jgi:Zn finger protein HypA/HybF involved in hydrogenase expression